MILKAIQVFVPELTKLELGVTATRASRLLNWLTSVELAVNPAGPHVVQWWKWCRDQAHEAHTTFLNTPMQLREHVVPATDRMASDRGVDSAAYRRGVA